MSKPAAQEIVGQLARDARWASAESRRCPHSRDYWRGQSRAYLAAARRLAHAAYGLSWCGARDRAFIARHATPATA